MKTKPKPIAALRNIHEMIRKITETVPGWTSLEQLHALYTLAVSTASLKRGDFLEVGSWCGRSTAVLGLAAKAIGDTKTISIDLFPEKTDWRRNPDRTYSFRVTIDGRTYGAYERQTVWEKPYKRDIAPLYAKHCSVFDVYRRTISKYRLRDIVRTHRGDIKSYLRTSGASRRFRLAFIDGDHSYESVAGDIARVAPCLVRNGWLCFDDAFSGYHGVDKAIRTHIIKNPDYSNGHLMTRKFFTARKTIGGCR